jgi:tetratricopeptide (TPR) repeat protein
MQGVFGMKRIILTGILALATGVSSLLAQQAQQAKPQQGQQQPAAQPQQQEQLVPGTKSKAESDAVIAMVQAQNNPDAMIKAAEELLTKYSDTVFKEQALYMQAIGYQQKGDLDRAQIFAEKVLETNPKNFQASLMLGGLLAQRTRENDLDREEKLQRAEKHLTGTIETLKTAPKPNPQLTDEQWEEGKKFITAEAHNSLGLIALTRKKYDVAIAEFRTANEGDPQPAYQVRLASALLSSGKVDEAVAIVDKLLADPQLHPQIKNVAQAIKNDAAKVKK